jgi:quercetin dioxygenase-like cupin family protein
VSERGTVVALRDAAPLELAPGVTMRPLFGDGAMLNLLEFEPGARVDTHQHPHEQLGYVLEGTLVLAIAGVDHLLSPGDGYQIPRDTPHSAWSEGRCLVLDVFQPVRDDYRERASA